ncbi:MAG TPA: SMP-30/gluconolactonase/LRE family protein [Chloroflexaceae bacterium]|nr:SMP-30/gluconolactonase/LRE family protein [Chloroflexaceae bacterium]
MSYPSPQLIVQERCATGEGPLWNPFDRRLYWVDIPRGRLYSYDPVGGTHELCLEGPPIGGFTIQADGALLLFGARGSVRRYQDGHESTMIEELPAERATRFNDVIADPRGRVFCGTMPGPDHPARLYRLELDGSATLVLDNLGQSNGMGFTPDGAAFYFTDTRAGTITRFRYNSADGALSDPAVFARIAEDDAPPDGLAVDAEGRVWSARYGGGCLVGYDPSGREVERIALPTSRVTSAGFGGADGRDLYITTAGGEETSPAEDPGAGGLFRTRLPVAGRPEFRSRVGL